MQLCTTGKKKKYHYVLYEHQTFIVMYARFLILTIDLREKNCCLCQAPIELNVLQNIVLFTLFHMCSLQTLFNNGNSCPE